MVVTSPVTAARTPRTFANHGVIIPPISSTPAIVNAGICSASACSPDIRTSAGCITTTHNASANKPQKKANPPSPTRIRFAPSSARNAGASQPPITTASAGKIGTM